MHRMPHRPLMAGLSVLALLAVLGCAQDIYRPTSTGTSGSSGMDSNRNATPSGTSGDPAYSVQPQSRRGTTNPPGAGVPMEPANRPPSQTPSTLSGDAGKRTTGEPGGN